MGNEQRLVIGKVAKFCLKCMDKEAVSSLQHSRVCPVNTKKHYYSCKSEKCLYHMWVCTKHHDVNKEHMERFQEQLRSKSGIRLVFMAFSRGSAGALPSVAFSVPQSGPPSVLPSVPFSVPPSGLPGLHPSVPFSVPPNGLPSVLPWVPFSVPPPTLQPHPPKSLGSTHSYYVNEGIGIKKAVRKLHRINKKYDPDVETISTLRLHVLWS